MEFKNLIFNKSNQNQFSSTIRRRVNEYFQNNKVSRYANSNMIVKTLIMFALYFIPYALMLILPITSNWIIILLYVLMGFGVAGLGLNVMHDANHEVFSRGKKINYLLSLTMNLIGSSSSMWRIQHNVLHHTFTNINDFDEDIESIPFLLRFAPHQKRRKIHKYQYIYAWFFYSLLTLNKVFYSDFSNIFIYRKKGFIKSKKEVNKEIVLMIISKGIYLGYTLFIPIFLLSIAWWVPLIGFLIMHLIAGFILSVIFQAAHILPETSFPLPNEKGEMDDSWMIHELLTTSNFGTKSKILTWLIGGLNFQVEHHLFSNICHVHYNKISKIVKETTKEFNVPYLESKTFWSALIQHGRMLKQLGRA